ncbi:MAG TPA: hypothetical protein ENN07_05265 [candidate division Zixibacteria bacterium]|nr:hypothetical protein [candidate division Zixibacteria bacterium]
MIKWAIIIGALAIFQILGLLFDFPQDYLFIGPLLILLSVLAMLYRVYNKIRQGERERLQRELDSLKDKMETIPDDSPDADDDRA